MNVVKGAVDLSRCPGLPPCLGRFKSRPPVAVTLPLRRGRFSREERCWIIEVRIYHTCVIVHYSTGSCCCHRAKLMVPRQGRERSEEQSLSNIMSSSEGVFFVVLFLRWIVFCNILYTLLYASWCEAIFHTKWNVII